MNTFHQQLARTPARVRRDGVIETVPASELATGEIVVLAAGDIVPADCRLLSCSRLRVRESVLTGESVPVDKTGDPRCLCLDEFPIWEQHNMAFCGTRVTDGSGLGLVTATGERSAYGRIVAMTQAVQPAPHRLQHPRPDATQMLIVLLLILLGIFVLLGLLQFALFASALLTAGAMSLQDRVLPMECIATRT